MYIANVNRKCILTYYVQIFHNTLLSLSSVLGMCGALWWDYGHLRNQTEAPKWQTRDLSMDGRIFNRPSLHQVGYINTFKYINIQLSMNLLFDKLCMPHSSWWQFGFAFVVHITGVGGWHGESGQSLTMFKYCMFPFWYYCFFSVFQVVKYSCKSMYLYKCNYYNSPLIMNESTANGLNFTTLSCMHYISTYYYVYHMCVIFCAVLNKIQSFIA